MNQAKFAKIVRQLFAVILIASLLPFSCLAVSGAHLQLCRQQDGHLDLCLDEENLHLKQLHQHSENEEIAHHHPFCGSNKSKHQHSSDFIPALNYKSSRTGLIISGPVKLNLKRSLVAAVSEHADFNDISFSPFYVTTKESVCLLIWSKSEQIFV